MVVLIGMIISVPLGIASAIYITDMKGRSTLLKYEDHGISPDIPLNNQSDWIEQVVGIIRKK
mgnify:CR=1 FL=1